MSVGFGFSAGDFIAALNLVSTVVDALRDSGDSSTEYRELISQLYTLETALISVKRIELNDTQHAEHIALMQAASQCQRTIDAFWEKIKKYQPSLKTGGTGSRVKDSWRKVRWAVCRKEDLRAFKANLMGHTESIEMLLTTVQMAATRIDSKKNEEQHRTMAGKLQESYFGCMQRMNFVLDRISTGVQQGKQLLEMTAKVFQTNVQIFQIVVKIQDIITRIPGQVERQQPVFFVDALGRHMAFHLEFVLSAEALTSVLRSNFKDIGPGAKEIEKGEFVIQDSQSKMDVDLADPWETCFRPGQHANMSMVFKSQDSTDRSCPKCRDENTDVIAKDEDIECRKCKMIYRRCVAIVKMVELVTVELISDTAMLSRLKVDSHRAMRTKKRSLPHDEESDMALFRRVRIRTEVVKVKPEDTIHAPTTPPHRMAHISRENSPPGAPLHPTSQKRNNLRAPADAPRTSNLVPLADDTTDPNILRMLEEERNRDLSRSHHPKSREFVDHDVSPFIGDNRDLDQTLSGDPWYPLFPQDDEMEKDIFGSIDNTEYGRLDIDTGIDPDAEEAFNEEESRERTTISNAELMDLDLQDELDREAAVDREIDDMMARQQLPQSDSDSDFGDEYREPQYEESSGYDTDESREKWE
ncbi:hypothetical protein VTL71DRAFT_4833 [Oculimacula yallundae]|uniref:Fungal N-terminal domain-containing protein n=1 Tax=Oculimacula yallundae TaxID=86028 RepID=A0ABR4C4V6_9HELO